MALNIDANFEGKLALLLKMTEKFSKFHQNTLEGLKPGTLMGFFYPKQKMYQLKIYRGIMCHDNEE